MQGDGRRDRSLRCRARLFEVFALVSTLGALPTAHSKASPALPQCPYPCGDNTDLFCNQRITLEAGRYVDSEIAAGLGPEDGWDVRIFQVDAPPDGAGPGKGGASFQVRKQTQKPNKKLCCPFLSLLLFLSFAEVFSILESHRRSS